MHIILKRICKIANTRKNGAFVVKIANIRAWRKLLWPFLRSLKGFQLLPPCEVQFFPSFFFYIFWMKFVDYILVTIKENVLITWNCDLILFYLLRLASKSSLSWCQELSRRPIERKNCLKFWIWQLLLIDSQTKVRYLWFHRICIIHSLHSISQFDAQTFGFDREQSFDTCVCLGVLRFMAT